MIRYYGKKSFRAAVIHGGPGAPGSVACIARELSKTFGVIEPIQSRYSVSELIEELRQQLQSVTQEPLTLIGHSWGAWLAVLYAAEYPRSVRQLVLIGGGPFEERFVPMITERRLSRLSSTEANEFRTLLSTLGQDGDSGEAMRRLSQLVEKSDNVDPLTFETDELDLLPVDGKMYASVWPEAAELRRNGKLAEYLNKLNCPVHVLHGESDPHPVEGIVEPLQENHVDFTCHVLKNSGHSPFKERQAYREFYRILMENLHENKNGQK